MLQTDRKHSRPLSPHRMASATHKLSSVALLTKLKQASQESLNFLKLRHPSEFRALSREVQVATKMVRRAISLGQRGYSKERIARIVGSVPSAITNWLEGRFPPSISDRSVEGCRSKQKLYVPPRTFDTNFAFILGFLTAQHEFGKPFTPHFTFLHSDHRTAQRLQRIVEKVFGETIELQRVVKGETHFFATHFYSTQLAEHLNEVTANNTRLPWEHIGLRRSSAEARSYLRGLYFKHGNIQGPETSPSITFSKKDGKRLIIDLAWLHQQLGIICDLSFKGRACFNVRGSENFRKLEQILRPSQTLFALKLAALVSGLPKARSSLDDYRWAMTHQNRSAAAIARRLGRDIQQIRSWLRKKVKPDIVKKLHTLQKLTKGQPSPHRINYNFRERGLSSARARLAAASS